MQKLPLKMAVLSLILVMGTPSANPADEDPVRSVLDPGVIPTRQALTPAGVQTVFGGRVHAVAFSTSNDTVFALTNSQRAAQVYRLDWSGNKVVERARAAVTPSRARVSSHQHRNGTSSSSPPRTRLFED